MIMDREMKTDKKGAKVQVSSSCDNIRNTSLTGRYALHIPLKP